MRRLRFLAPVLLLPLFGCNTPNAQTQVASCPDSAVLAQAASVTKLRPGAPDKTNVVLTATMMPAVLNCDYDAKTGKVSVDLQFTVDVDSGAAAANAGPQDLPYFVAVMDGQGHMVTKHTFDRKFDLAGRATATYTEYVSDTEINLPNNAQPFEYQILTGFQLTPAELAYNRNQHPQVP